MTEGISVRQLDERSTVETRSREIRDVDDSLLEKAEKSATLRPHFFSSIFFLCFWWM